MKFNIKNWSEFQQYKDGRPLHWIKLHVSLLDDFAFNQLPELSQLHLIKLWAVAAKKGGEIEGDENWLAKQVNAKKVDISTLVQAGFLVRTDSYDIVPREEKSREEEKRVEESREDKSIVTLKRDDVADVFNHWRAIMNKPKASLDDKRKGFITKALKNYSAEDIKQAIVGCSLTPHNIGDNDRGQRYDGVHVILKDADQIDRFMANADNPPTGRVKTIEQSKAGYSAQGARLARHLGVTE